MGVHGFSGKKLGPTWGTVYKYKVKDHKSLSRLKDRSKTCKKLQKGIQLRETLRSQTIKIIHKIICTKNGRRW